MVADPKGLAVLIAESKKSPSAPAEEMKIEGPAEEVPPEEESLNIATEEVMSAIAANDVEGLKEALRSFIQML